MHYHLHHQDTSLSGMLYINKMCINLNENTNALLEITFAIYICIMLHNVISYFQIHDFPLVFATVVRGGYYHHYFTAKDGETV